MGNHPNRSKMSKVWDNFGMGWIAASPRYGCSSPFPTRADALEWLLSKGIKPEHIEG